MGDHGVARLPERQATVAIAEGRLRTILDDYAPPPRALHALYPSAGLPPKVAVALELLKSLFSGG